MENERWRTTAAGVRMPWIIYGTAWKEERTADLVEQAILAGFKGIDTACQPRHYREPLVGEALRRLSGRGIGREDIYLQTKYSPAGGQDPQSIPYDPAQPVSSQVRQSLAVSLRNLGTEYVDGLILHSPLATHGATMEAWSAMEDFYQDGSVRQLGISNCYYLPILEKLYADATVKPAVLQNRFYRDTGYDIEIRRWCNERNIVYQSFWTLTANPHLLGHEIIKGLAARYARTIPQVFFRFLNQLNIVVLTGTCSVHHMREDLAALDFTLSPEEVAMVGRLL